MCLQKLELERNSPEISNLSELERDIQELKANYRKSRLIKFLRFLLIGFLFGNDIEKRIVELTERIQNRISANFSEVNKIVSEIEGSGTYLIYSEKSHRDSH
jgi:hypothetical protein